MSESEMTLSQRTAESSRKHILCGMKSLAKSLLKNSSNPRFSRIIGLARFATIGIGLPQGGKAPAVHFGGTGHRGLWPVVLDPTRQTTKSDRLSHTSCRST